MSEFVRILSVVGVPASILAIGVCAWRMSRSWLLLRAGSVALNPSSDEKCRKAALKIIDKLTDDSVPWYKAILPWHKPDDGSGP